MSDTDLKDRRILEPTRRWYCVKCGFENDGQSESCADCESPNHLIVTRQQSESASIVIEKKKSRLGFILLGLFFGYIGIHNVYAGRKSEAYFQLFLGLFLSWTIIVPIMMYFWSLVEIFTIKEDGLGRPMK